MRILHKHFDRTSSLKSELILIMHGEGVYHAHIHISLEAEIAATKEAASV